MFFFSNSDFRPPIWCHFFRTTLFWEKLHFHTFSEQLLRHSSYFFGTAISSEQLLLFPFSEQPLFRRSFRIKMSKKIFQNRCFCTVTTFSEKICTSFFWRTAFLGWLLFQKMLPSIAATFSEELLFYNILFQKSYYFTATVPFHSYTTYLFVSN